MFKFGILKKEIAGGWVVWTAGWEGRDVICLSVGSGRSVGGKVGVVMFLYLVGSNSSRLL